jgi:hypothetical protein
METGKTTETSCISNSSDNNVRNNITTGTTAQLAYVSFTQPIVTKNEQFRRYSLWNQDTWRTVLLGCDAVWIQG